jgi:hypothetical protein
MAKTKIVINRASFGKNVMAGPGVTKVITGIAETVASKLRNGKVTVEARPASGGGSRVHASISNGTTDKKEAETNELTIALLSTVKPK